MHILPPFRADDPHVFEQMPISIDLNVLYVAKPISNSQKDAVKPGGIAIGGPEKVERDVCEVQDASSNGPVTQSPSTNDVIQDGSKTTATGEVFSVYEESRWGSQYIHCPVSSLDGSIDIDRTSLSADRKLLDPRITLCDAQSADEPLIANATVDPAAPNGVQPQGDSPTVIAGEASPKVEQSTPVEIAHPSVARHISLPSADDTSTSARGDSTAVDVPVDPQTVKAPASASKDDPSVEPLPQGEETPTEASSSTSLVGNNQQVAPAPISSSPAKTSGAQDLPPGHQRKITRSWPRAPGGKTIESPDDYSGITAPNAIPMWGATMQDFYKVQRSGVGADRGTSEKGSEGRDEKEENGFLRMSGSMLAKMAAELKEEGFAVEEMERAQQEAKEGPMRMEVDFLTELLVQQEERIRLGQEGKGWPREDKEADKGGGAEQNEEVTATAQSGWQYPPPWPTVPFSYEAERIQRQIPLDELPRRLIVHDPWNLLAVDYRNSHGAANDRPVPETTDHWTQKADITYVYKLALSQRAREYRERVSEEAKAEKAEDKGTNDPGVEAKPGGSEENGFVIPLPLTSTLGPTSPSSVFVVHDPKPTGMEEAHLYLSSSKRCGVGNHSVVWFAEWELPRSYLIPSSEEESHVLCRECIIEDVVKILGEEDKEKKAAQETESVGDIMMGPDPDANADQAEELEALENDDKQPEAEKPLRRIRTAVKWQDLSMQTCSHVTATQAPQATPPTVKVRVAAKLSHEGDIHLRREARNYECFPQHFFEHWSGLNLLGDAEDPVPLGPIVPQFYGYYTPENEDEDGGFFSPIMLVEDCGNQVAFWELTTDERNEAASLWFRFHHAGWLHHSPYSRNMVGQAGPLNVPPSKRVELKNQRQMSFRLIDFGRSHAPGVPTSYFTANYTHPEEVTEVRRMCGLSNCWC